MKYLAMLSSMPFESELIRSRLRKMKEIDISGRTALSGQYSSRDILLLHTGIGKVNAAHALTLLMENCHVTSVVNIGVGGAYPGSGLEVGDVAAATREFYGDDGVYDYEGWHDLRKIGIPLFEQGGDTYFNEFPVGDPSAPSHGLSGEVDMKKGNFVTVGTATGTVERAYEIAARFHAVCENMEGAAIAHVCTMYRIPMIEIRGISNMAGVRDKRKWKLGSAAENCQKAVLKLLLKDKGAA